MLTVHHLNNSRSQRVLWMLEELGVEYDIKRYQRDPKTMLAPPELRAIHPLGKSPVIARRIGDGLQSGFIDPQLKLHFGYIEDELTKAPYFVGDDFSAADVQMSFPLETGTQRAGDSELPRIRAFLGRIHERPAYRRALERGGQYDYA
jgi:glutathione S-transferase